MQSQSVLSRVDPSLTANESKRADKLSVLFSINNEQYRCAEEKREFTVERKQVCSGETKFGSEDLEWLCKLAANVLVFPYLKSSCDCFQQLLQVNGYKHLQTYYLSPFYFQLPIPNNTN